VNDEGLGSRMFKMMFGERSARSLYPIPEGDGWHYEPVPDDSCGALAAATGRSAFEVYYDTLMMDEGKGVLWRGRDNVIEWYDSAREDLLAENCVPGISDAGAQ
jgi:N-acyl-D-aspartate/D-glutamate deacylase